MGSAKLAGAHPSGAAMHKARTFFFCAGLLGFALLLPRLAAASSPTDPILLDHAPDLPVLVSPADGAIDVVVPAIERVFNVQFLSKDVYYISDLPSELRWEDVLAIAIVSLVMSLIATLYPSWRASKINPAEALRYE